MQEIWRTRHRVASWSCYCSKTVVVRRSERSKLDQKDADRHAGKLLKNQLK